MSRAGLMLDPTQPQGGVLCGCVFRQVLGKALGPQSPWALSA